MKKILLFLVPAILAITCGQIPLADAEEYPAVVVEEDTLVRKPRNIILMIGDGMGLTQISAGMYANDNKLNLEQFKYIGLIKTHSADDLITDSAAGATAFATGKKTYNKAISVGTDSLPLTTILEVAEQHGLSTGLAATASITHATPAAFIAHDVYRYNDEAIAMDFLATDIDIFIGGGRQYFSQRKDGFNLLDSLKTRNYNVTDKMDEVTDKGKWAVFTDEKHPASVAEGRDENYLRDASEKAINLLRQNDTGFFLMIEGSQIDWGGHDNSSSYIIDEMIDFDRAVGAVLEFAKRDGNTLVIVTADHETGGYAINGGSVKDGKVQGAFTTTHHTAVMVPVFAFGPGAEEFTGIYENTAVFDKMMKLYGF